MSQPSTPTVPHAPAGDLEQLAQRCQGLSPAERRRALCDDQSLRWQAGQPAPLEAYLAAFPELADDPHALLPLVVGEWLQRFDRDDPPYLDDYQRRFPHLAEELARQFDLHLALSRSRARQTTAAPAAAPALPTVPGYDVVGRLGHGGMGVVYKAHQRNLNRPVALKALSLGAHSPPEQLARFRQEAELLARLHHPHIVQVYEAGTCPELGAYLVMEFVDGPNLAQQCAGRPQAPTEAARLVEVLARAVGHAHRQGILHRDIKPSNVLMAPGGVPKLTDFGLGKLVESGDGLTESGDVFGTPAYMSPEQARGEVREIGPAADVYALGATLYDLLTGRPPFQGASPLEVLQRVCEEEPSAIRRARRDVPADLEITCLKCLQKEPGRRYASAEALAEDLHRFLTGRPITARRVRAGERAWRWARRQPVLAGALTVAVVGALATILLSVWFALYQRQTNTDLRRKQTETEEALFQSRLQSAQLAKERGLSLLRQGEANPGLLWLTYALETAPAEATEFQRDLRSQLGHWAGQGIPLRQVLGHPAGVTAVAFSPDGRTIFTGGSDGPVRRWDARTGDLLDVPASLANGGGSLVCSSDGTTLCALNAKERHFLDATTGQRLPQPRGQFPPWEWLTAPWVRYSANGKTVIRYTPLPGTLLLGRAALTTETAPGKFHTINISPALYYALALSPDGQSFLNSSSTTAVYSSQTGAPLGQPIGESLPIQRAVFRPDGKALLIANSLNVVREWDVLSGKALSPPLPHPVRITALAYSPDGRQALIACADGAVRLWGLTPPRPVFHDYLAPAALADRSGPPIAPLALRVTESLPGDGQRFGQLQVQQGRFFWLTEQHGLRSYDGERTERWGTLPLPEGGGRFTISPDRELVAVALTERKPEREEARPVCLYEARSGRTVGPPLVHPDTVYRLAFSPDGKVLATSCFDGRVRFWDIRTGKPASPDLSHPRTYPYLALSPDGSRVLTGWDGQARLWDRATGRPLLDFPHPGLVTSVAFSPEGTQALIGGDATARLWDTETGKPIGPAWAHPQSVLVVAFHPNGRVALTATTSQLQLWEASAGLPLGPPLPWDRGSLAVGFSGDGQAVLVGTTDRLRILPLPAPAEGDARRLTLSVQVWTGLELDAGGAVHVLDAATWNERRRHLQEQGGSLLP